MDFLICGFGKVGHHVMDELGHTDSITPYIYDKNDPLYNDERILRNSYDVAFVCVPTESMADGQADTSIVEEMVPKIRAEAIVIKSAVPVGTCDGMPENVLVSPEYYGTTQHSLDFPNFLVLGGSKRYAEKVVELYSHVKSGDFHFCFVERRTAELVKYMENCWIATKVTFCNEFARIAGKVGVPYGELREAWLCDERVSSSHTYVYPNKPYYDSHCLDKDIPALIASCKDFGIHAGLMEAVDAENQRQKAIEHHIDE